MMVMVPRGPKVSKMVASFPSAKCPDRSGTMGTDVDGCGGKRCEYIRTLMIYGGVRGEGITICFESEKHLFENDCGHKKNTHLMKASVHEL